MWSVAFSRDGTRAVSGSVDKSARIWNEGTGDTKRSLKDHSGEVYSVAFLHDGTQLVSGSDDRTVRVWNGVTRKTKRVAEGLLFGKAATGKTKRVLNGSFCRGALCGILMRRDTWLG